MPKKGQKIDLSPKEWEKIKTEYVTSDVSYRMLSNKYGMTYKRLQERGSQEGWREQRSEYRKNLANKSLDIICEAQANRIAKAVLIGDRMLEKVEEALNEIDIVLAKQTTTIETIGVDKDGNSFTKKEATEDYRTVQVAIDKSGLRQLSAVLKDLKEIGIFRSELDRREQEARINKLCKDAEDTTENEAVEILIGEEVNEYSN
jgi:hypothetical protein